MGSDLVSRIRSGDEQAFESVFRANYEHLYHFAASYLNDAAAAEDVVTGVFGWLWVNRVGWKPNTTIEAYLYGAVRNRCQNFRRDTKKRAEHLEIIENEQSGNTLDNDALVFFDNLDVNESVEAAINQLPQLQREIVTLRWLKHMSWDEIEEIFGTSRKALQMQHTRALSRLKALLE